MFGFILAALYVAYSSITNVPIETSLVGSLNFLWYWHLTFACILGIIPLGLAILGLFVMGVGNTTEKLGGFGVLALSPIVALLLGMRSFLLLGGVWLMLAASQAGGTVAEWNQSKLIIGLIVYLVGLVALRGNSYYYKKKAE